MYYKLFVFFSFSLSIIVFRSIMQMNLTYSIKLCVVKFLQVCCKWNYTTFLQVTRINTEHAASYEKLSESIELKHGSDIATSSMRMLPLQKSKVNIHMSHQPESAQNKTGPVISS